MKKNNLKLISFMLISFALLSSCRKEITPDTEYDRIKKMSYSQMSNPERIVLQNGLADHLRKDPDFLAANKLLDYQSKAIVEAVRERRSKGLKRPVIDKSLSETQKLKLQGIKDPETFKKNRILMLVKMAAVIKKYPELHKLEKQARKETLKKASIKKTKL